jgi:hypothetical protein
MSGKIYVLQRFICVAKTSRQELEELASHSFRKLLTTSKIRQKFTGSITLSKYTQLTGLSRISSA